MNTRETFSRSAGDTKTGGMHTVAEDNPRVSMVVTARSTGPRLTGRSLMKISVNFKKMYLGIQNL